MSSEGLPVDGVVGVGVELSARNTEQATDVAKSSLSADSAAESADASFKFSRIAKNESIVATSAADRAELAAGNAENIADANTYYISQEDPDGTIAGIAGTSDGKLFRVAIPDASGTTIAFNYYKNNGGVAEFVNSEPNKRYLDQVKTTADLAAEQAEFLTGLLPQDLASVFPDLHYAFLSKDRVGLLTIDKQNYAQFAGMRDKLQERLAFIGDRLTANSIRGWHHIFKTQDDVVGAGIDTMLKFWLAGMPDAIQDRLRALGNAQLSAKIRDLIWVGATDETLTNCWGVVGGDFRLRLAGMKSAVNDLENGVPALVRPHNGKLALFANALDSDPIWSSGTVVGATPISDGGVVFTYRSAGGAINAAVITRVKPRDGYKTRELDPDTFYIYFIPGTGQSLCATQAGTSVVKRDATLDGHALMFQGEFQDRGPVQDEIVDQDKLGALTDLSPPVQSRGAGMSQHILRTMRDQGLQLPTIVTRTHAFGGASYEQIKKGTNTYNSGQTNAAEFVRQALMMGKSPVIPAMFLTHGEADSALVDAIGQYYGRADTLINTHQSDYQQKTGQAKKPLVFIDQLGSRIRTVSPRDGSIIYGDFIAKDQLQLSIDRADVILSTPKYHINRRYPIDQQHLSQRGYTLLDEYVGQSIHWTLFDTLNNPEHQKWNPVQVESWTIVDNVLRINFKKTPLGHALTIDNETLGAAPFGGVDFEQGTALINHFEQVSETEFEWGLNHPPTSGDFIRLGFNATDPGGFPTPYDKWIFPLLNIRDTSPTMSRYVPGEHLWNWATLDRIPV